MNAGQWTQDRQRQARIWWCNSDVRFWHLADIVMNVAYVR